MVTCRDIVESVINGSCDQKHTPILGCGYIIDVAQIFKNVERTGHCSISKSYLIYICTSLMNRRVIRSEPRPVHTLLAFSKLRCNDSRLSDGLRNGSSQPTLLEHQHTTDSAPTRSHDLVSHHSWMLATLQH